MNKDLCTLLIIPHISLSCFSKTFDVFGRYLSVRYINKMNDV